jgi:hypothetical protein
MPVRVTKINPSSRVDGARKTKSAGKRGRDQTPRLGYIPPVEESELFNAFFRNLVADFRRVRDRANEHENRLNGFIVDAGTSAVTFDNGGV